MRAEEDPQTQAPPLLIGGPERELARDALEEHLVDGRIDTAELDRRTEAVGLARDRAELMRIFADLPAPHPRLPSPPAPDGALKDPADSDEDDDPPGTFVAVLLALVLGFPVAIVIGIVYGAWWALAVPVAVSVLLSWAADVLGRFGRARDNENQTDRGTE